MARQLTQPDTMTKLFIEGGQTIELMESSCYMKIPTHTDNLTKESVSRDMAVIF